MIVVNTLTLTKRVGVCVRESELEREVSVFKKSWVRSSCGYRFAKCFFPQLTVYTDVFVLYIHADPANPPLNVSLLEIVQTGEALHMFHEQKR